MKKWFIAGALAASLTTVAAADELTGYVSDAHCGAKHSSVSEANTKCVNGCLKGGAAPVIVIDDKVYKVSGDSVDKVKALAGDKVKVDGSIQGDTITVASIEEVK